MFVVTERPWSCFLFKHCRTLVAAAYTGDTFAKYYGGYNLSTATAGPLAVATPQYRICWSPDLAQDPAWRIEMGYFQHPQPTTFWHH